MDFLAVTPESAITLAVAPTTLLTTTTTTTTTATTTATITATAKGKMSLNDWLKIGWLCLAIVVASGVLGILANHFRARARHHHPDSRVPMQPIPAPERPTVPQWMEMVALVQRHQSPPKAAIAAADPHDPSCRNNNNHHRHSCSCSSDTNKKPAVRAAHEKNSGSGNDDDNNTKHATFPPPTTEETSSSGGGDTRISSIIDDSHRCRSHGDDTRIRSIIDDELNIVLGSNVRSGDDELNTNVTDNINADNAASGKGEGNGDGKGKRGIAQMMANLKGKVPELNVQGRSRVCLLGACRCFS